MKKSCLFAVILAVGMLYGCMAETIDLCGKGDACGDPPPTGDWACNDDDTSASLTYCPEGNLFQYTLSGVVPNVEAEYTLIYYPDPWPGEGLICLSEPTSSDADGKISLNGKVEINTDLPIASDANFDDGAKLWLVPSGMVDCEGQVMANWADCPGILFEKSISADRVFYTDTGL